MQAHNPQRRKLIRAKVVQIEGLARELCEHSGQHPKGGLALWLVAEKFGRDQHQGKEGDEDQLLDEDAELVAAGRMTS